MTSTDSKKRAACCEKCMDSTAPIAKFGAIEHRDVGVDGQPAADLPEPLFIQAGGATTASMPFSMRNFEFHRHAWGG